MAPSQSRTPASANNFAVMHLVKWEGSIRRVTCDAYPDHIQLYLVRIRKRMRHSSIEELKMLRCRAFE